MKSLYMSSPSIRSYDMPRLNEVELMLRISSPRSIELFSVKLPIGSFTSKGLTSGCWGDYVSETILDIGLNTMGDSYSVIFLSEARSSTG